MVRLVQGDFDRETAYDADPVATAREFATGGAAWLHVVDLDAARTGVPAHRAIIAAIAAAVGEGVRVEVAGGLRDARAVAEVLEGGAARAVIGTAALAYPTFAGELVTAHGAERIAVAIDVRDGRAVGHGWADDATGVDAVDAIRRLADAGRPDLRGDRDRPRRPARRPGPRRSTSDSWRLDSRHDHRLGRHHERSPTSWRFATSGCGGAIIGRALYEGRLSTPRRDRRVTVTDGIGQPPTIDPLGPARRSVTAAVAAGRLELLRCASMTFSAMCQGTSS